MKEQTELTLDQQLQQAENAYKTAQQSFEYAQKISETAIKQAGLGLTTAESQFDALKNTFQMQKIALLNILDSVVESADSLLGVTEYYENQINYRNNSQGKVWERYLGANDVSQREMAKKELKLLYSLSDAINKLDDIPQTGNQLLESVQLLDSGYQNILSFSILMVKVLKSSDPLEDGIGESVINRHIQTFQTFQS